MTSTITRPPVRSARPDRDPAPHGLAAAARGGGTAVLQGLLLAGVVTWLLWLAEDRSSSGLPGVAASAGQLWLAALGADLATPTGELGLTPLGLLLVPLLLARRAGRAAAGAPVGLVVLVVAAVHAFAAVAVALVSETPALQPDAASALLGALAVGGAGAWAGAGGLARTRDRVPPAALPVARAGAAATGLLLAASALLAGLALALDGGTAVELAEATEPGAVGGLGLALLGAVLVPNAVVWAASWLAGPGFAVGAGTAVTPSTTELGAVPGLPLAAALPGGPPPSWAVLALIVPVLVGVVAARWLPRGGPRATALSAAGCGSVAGAVVGVLAVLAGGPLGGAHLAVVGPAAVPTVLAVAGEVALGAALGLLLRRRAS